MQAPFIGGPLLDPLAGVYGVIHKEVCGRIEATLMGDIFEYLDRFEKHGYDQRKYSYCYILSNMRDTLGCLKKMGHCYGAISSRGFTHYDYYLKGGLLLMEMKKKNHIGYFV